MVFTVIYNTDPVLNRPHLVAGFMRPLPVGVRQGVPSNMGAHVPRPAQLRGVPSLRYPHMPGIVVYEHWGGAHGAQKLLGLPQLCVIGYGWWALPRGT
jgi:hypothetical protein